MVTSPSAIANIGSVDRVLDLQGAQHEIKAEVILPKWTGWTVSKASQACWSTYHKTKSKMAALQLAS